MSKLRRGGFIFVSWIGDHSPKHVHVYRDGQLIVKWDLENNAAMQGAADRRLRRLIDDLHKEGLL
ncbi:MAG: hypothetical protein H0U92_13660 [Actinobacteria bacterium]|nr:hypothetical protein [Actinomycetota bacterium]